MTVLRVALRAEWLAAVAGAALVVGIHLAHLTRVVPARRRFDAAVLWALAHHDGTKPATASLLAVATGRRVGTVYASLSRLREADAVVSGRWHMPGPPETAQARVVYYLTPDGWEAVGKMVSTVAGWLP